MTPLRKRMIEDMDLRDLQLQIHQCMNLSPPPYPETELLERSKEV